MSKSPLQLKVDLGGVPEYFERLPESTYKQAREVFAKSVLAADRKVKRNATDLIKVRTGRLRRSIRHSVSGMDLATLRASVFSGHDGGGKTVIYAPIHEFGGTVKAKNAYLRVPGGPYLNVPIGENLTAAGVMRLSAQMVFAQGGYIWRAKKGKRWLVMLGGEPMFVLIKQTKIKAQLGMRKAADDEVDVILAGLKKVLGEE